jgi:hypothetical protein
MTAVLCLAVVLLVALMVWLIVDGIRIDREVKKVLGDSPGYKRKK